MIAKLLGKEWWERLGIFMGISSCVSSFDRNENSLEKSESLGLAQVI